MHNAGEVQVDKPRGGGSIIPGMKMEKIRTTGDEATCLVRVERVNSKLE